MMSSILSHLIILVCGNLYPAYASYKAIRAKNTREYLKWMMYWIVFALFTCIEAFTGKFLSWFPCYYEIKVLIVLWLLSPATKGSSKLYQKYVHPMLTRREQELDQYLNQAKELGYSALLQLGSKLVNYATNALTQTAINTVNTANTAQYSSNAANEPGSSMIDRSLVMENDDAVSSLNGESFENEQIETAIDLRIHRKIREATPNMEIDAE